MRNTEGKPSVSEFGRDKKNEKEKKKERKMYRDTNQPPKSLTYISLLSLEPFLN